MRTTVMLTALGLGALAACSDSQGTPGALTLVKLSDEFASKDCPNGGQRVEAGRDDNRNASLEADEVTSTSFICDGSEGAVGEAIKGRDGDPGRSGETTAVEVTPEPPGAACEAGGQRIEVGPDSDGDGEIDASATTDTVYVCDGASGSNGATGQVALAVTTDEPAGAHCQHGGQRVDYGVDTNSDGSLDAGETAGTRYVCNGATGDSGSTPLFTVSAEPAGANCANGGQRVDYGQDLDANGTLEAGEMTGTRYTCTGATGAAAKRSLVTVDAEPVGANCAAGGQKVVHGFDDDGDGLLAVAEIDGSSYVCNGAAAANSHLALVAVVVEAPGGNCTGGGHKVTAGLDDDDDKMLDAVEVDATSYVCDFDDFVNGSFEQADYAGWTVSSTSSGQWLLVATGTTLQSGQSWFDYADRRNETINSIGLPLTVASTQGTNVAVQLQLAPGIHRIYQDFTVPLAASTLKWDMYYKNTWNTFTNNQYVAVNVRDPLTDAVIATLFKTKAGDPLLLAGMTPFSADLSAYAGSDVRFDIETNIQLSWIDVALDNFVIQ